MKKTGELLKKAREERGLSLHEVALFLKINSRVLMAIEDGDQAQLPARTFLRGFIQSYAKFLKLDSNHVLSIFSEETTPVATTINTLVETNIAIPEGSSLDAEPEPKKYEPEQKIESDSLNLEKSILTKSQVTQDKLHFKTIAVSILGLVLVGILYTANNIVKKYQREAVVEPVEAINALNPAEGTEAPAETATEEKPTETPVPTPVPAPVVATATPAPAPTPVPPPMPVASPKKEEMISTSASIPEKKPITTHNPIMVSTPSIALSKTPDHPLSTDPVANPIVPVLNLSVPNVEANKSKVSASSEKPVEKTTEIAAPAHTSAPAPTPVAAAPTPAPIQPAASANSPSATPAPAPTTGKPVEVIVEAKDSVEIEYSSAKSPPQKMVLKADQIHTFKSRSGVRLKISNGGAVNIIMNGRDLGAPGEAGQSIQLAY